MVNKITLSTMWKKKEKVPPKNSYAKLIFEIIGERDYYIFKEMLSFLGYHDPGHYLRIVNKEFDSYLNKPVLYLESAYKICRDSFFGIYIGFRPKRREFQQSLFLRHETRILDKLNYGLIEYKFGLLHENLEYLNLYIEKCKSLNTYLNSIGENNERYISHMEVLLKQLKYDIQKKKESLKDSEIKKIPFELISDKTLFEAFILKLNTMGYISDIPAFTSVFIPTNTKYIEKVLWKGSQLSIVFLIELLGCYDIINVGNERSMTISFSFRTPKKDLLGIDSLNSQASNNKLTTLTKSNIEQLVIDSKKPDLMKIFEAFKTVYNIREMY